MIFESNYLPPYSIASEKQRDSRNELTRHYRSEMDKAMDNPDTEIVCHQRYTIRERIAKLLELVQFTPTHQQLTVTYVGGMFLWGTAPHK